MRKSNLTDDQLGKTAWDNYSAAVGGKAFNGDPLPTWAEMCKDEKKQNLVVAWRASARAVADAVLRSLPSDPPKPAPLAIVGAPSGRVAPLVAASSAPAPIRSLVARTKCCGSVTLSLKPGGRLRPTPYYECPCGDHQEDV